MQKIAYLLLLSISSVLSHRGYAQIPIEVSDLDWSFAINDHSVILPVPITQSIDIQQIWSKYTHGEFLPEASIETISKVSIGRYYICYLFCAVNNSNETISLSLKSKHTPVSVYKKQAEQFISIPFTAHAANHDPNGILPIKSRNTVSFAIESHHTDSILYITRILEAGESRDLLLFQAHEYAIKSLADKQWITLFNGIFLGILLVFLFNALYFYCRIKESFLIWYMVYLSIFVFYYWRDLEFWNEQLDFSHQYLSWYATKGPITYLIFLFYLLFFNSILKINKYSIIKKFLKITIGITPFLILIDFLLYRYQPYWSIIFTYSFGVLVGCIHLYLIVPIWKSSTHNSTLYLLIVGSLCIFLGWLSILFFDVSIHQYTVRIFTLIELMFFTLAIVERFLKIKQELNDAALLRVQELASERGRISAELHDDLGSTLSGISMYSYLAAHQLKSSDLKHAKNSLQIIQNNAQELVQKISEIVWLLHSQPDSFQKMTQRLYEYAISMTASKKIALNYHISNNLQDIYLPAESIKHIYLICKEAINNSVKYSDATYLSIEMKNIQNHLQIEIKDRGKGFESEKYNMGNGLVNMKKRAETIGAYFDIISNLALGTKIELRLTLA